MMVLLISLNATLAVLNYAMAAGMWYIGSYWVCAFNLSVGFFITCVTMWMINNLLEGK